METTGPNFYKQAVADLGAPDISSDALSQMIGRYTQSVPSGQAASNTNDDELAALLAAIAKSQRVVNGRFNLFPFSLQVPIGFAGISFQILPSNQNRKFFAVQYKSGTPCTLSFDSGPGTPQGITAANLAQLQATGLDLESLGNGGANVFQPNTAPTNPITIIVGGGAGAVGAGVVIEIAK